METTLEKTDVNPIQHSASTEIVTTRAAQEVQAAMVIAKKFPRNELAAIGRILQSCKRKGLADTAIYAYPRGGTQISGPSIRLAEAVAQNWGNIDFGIIELDQTDGESQVMSYAWDLESNTRVTKIFTVKHERKAKGIIKKLDDPRDIYELVANQGARRLRACILGVIPGDVIDDAVAECEKTLEGNNDEPLKDRIAKMIARFESLGVTVEMIEGRIQKNVSALLAIDIVNLGKIFKSINDVMSKKEDWFDSAPIKAPDTKPTKKKAAKVVTPKPATPPAKEEKPAKTEGETPAVIPPAAEEEEPLPSIDPDPVEPPASTEPAKPFIELLYDKLADAELNPDQLDAWAAKMKLDMTREGDAKRAYNNFDKVKGDIAKF